MLSYRMKHLTPYIPGEQPRDKKYIKLNTNENPYPPCPGIQSFLSSFNYESLRLYPDPLALKLRENIGAQYHLPPSSIFVGNGSDEVLSFAFYAFFDSERGELLYPEFTYSFYPVYCDFYSIAYKKIPMEKDFRINCNAFLEHPASCGIIFPNPNAPTGRYINLKEIKHLLDTYPGDRVVLIDEAYIDFGGESAVSLIPDYPNLVVTKTFSKSRSLAGIRLGYAVAQEPLIQALFTVKDSFNSYPVDTIAQNICSLAVTDDAYYTKINDKIISSREVLTQALKNLGWTVFPSLANFIFAGIPGIPGEKIYLDLKEAGILVRFFNTDGIKEYVRITIGTEEEIDIFINTVKKLFSS